MTDPRLKPNAIREGGGVGVWEADRERERRREERKKGGKAGVFMTREGPSTNP